ncbi:MAG TPA: hypothetical protein VKU37_10370 [Verrucomicrobiae bacterium]|nr:hypothetical protein [Verrucomicrobiae bacterium]
MKAFVLFGWFAGRRPGRQFVLLIAFVGVTAMLAVGCHKQSQVAAPETPPPAQPTNASQPEPANQATVVNSQPPPALDANTTNALPDLRPLNRALWGWVAQNGHRPANFEDFAATAGIEIPPLPPGKKYILNDRGLISIVNR